MDSVQPPSTRDECIRHHNLGCSGISCILESQGNIHESVGNGKRLDVFANGFLQSNFIQWYVFSVVFSLRFERMLFILILIGGLCIGTLYNAFLSFYFLFTARFGMKNEMIARRIEPAMHMFSVGYPILTGFIGLFLGVYAEPEVGLGCWVNR